MLEDGRGHDQLTLFQPRGTDYAHHITTSPPPTQIFGRCGVSLMIFDLHKVSKVGRPLKILCQILLRGETSITGSEHETDE